jgi:hypothetical protein
MFITLFINSVACRLKADYLSQRGRPLLSNIKLIINTTEMFITLFINSVACCLKADYLSQRGRPLLSNVYN